MKFKHKRINFSKEAFGIKYIVFESELRIMDNKCKERMMVLVNDQDPKPEYQDFPKLSQIHRSLQKAKNCKRKIILRLDNKTKNENRKH